MNIIVLGGGGYIGIPLVNKLLINGHKVKVIDRFYFGEELLKPHANLELDKQDIRHLYDCDFKGYETVIDLCGISNDPACDLNPEISARINYDGACNAINCAAYSDVKHYIYTSSCSVYGDSKQDEVNEASPTNPVSLYAKLKLDCEKYLFSINKPGFSVTALRNATVFGIAPRMRFDLIVNLMTLHAFKNKEIYVMGGGRQWRPLVHLRDLADVYQAVVYEGKAVNKEIFNVGATRNNYQVSQIAKIVQSAMPNTKISYTPDDNDKRSYRVNCDKLSNIWENNTFRQPYDGVIEIWNGLVVGEIWESIKTNTVGYYRYLLEVNKMLQNITIDGEIF